MPKFKQTAQCKKCRAVIVKVNGRWESQQHGPEFAAKCKQDGKKHEPR